MANVLILMPAVSTAYAARSGLLTSDAYGIISTAPYGDDLRDLLHMGGVDIAALGRGRDKISATTAPGATDDSVKDFAIGSLWEDTTNKKLYMCLDATATAAVWMPVSAGANTPVNTVAATLTLTSALHAGKTLTVNKADGTAITLPAATGTGDKFRIIIGTTITSVGSTIKVANGTDIMVGNAYVISDNSAAMLGYATASDSDTITMDGSTQGGYAGQLIEIQDVASGKFNVQMCGKATGTEATPFSATV